jgi:hypothetical protein
MKKLNEKENKTTSALSDEEKAKIKAGFTRVKLGDLSFSNHELDFDNFHYAATLDGPNHVTDIDNNLKVGYVFVEDADGKRITVKGKANEGTFHLMKIELPKYEYLQELARGDEKTDRESNAKQLAESVKRNERNILN